MASFEIRLQNCGFYGRHGVFEEEKTIGQRFYVDAVLTVLDSGALEHDDLSGTVHYGEAFQTIERLVTGEPRKLIEALAMDIAKALRADFPNIIKASITVRKPSAPIEGVLDYVEVTVCDPQ